MRRIIGLSSGKDSTALAIYLKNKIPELEYVFCDAQKESLLELVKRKDKTKARYEKSRYKAEEDANNFCYVCHL